MTTDIENHQKHQVKIHVCAFLDLSLVDHTLQSLFSPFCNRKFPAMSHTSGFGVKIKNIYIIINDIYESYFLIQSVVEDFE